MYVFAPTIEPMACPSEVHVWRMDHIPRGESEKDWGHEGTRFVLCTFCRQIALNDRRYLPVT